MLENITSFILLPIVFLSNLLSPAPVVDPIVDRVTHLEERVAVLDVSVEAQLNNLNSEWGEKFGASEKIPTPIALFEDSLRSGIDEDDTSFTLVRGTYGNATALASSTYGFIISEGSANEEFVLADCTGTACTNAIRGVDLLTGTTSIAALRKEHRRGDSVKISDAPIIQIMKRLINGEDTLPNILEYESGVTPTSGGHLVDKEYADDLAFNGAGVIQATTADDGVVEIATNTEVASSTASGNSGATLVVPASAATSTYHSSGSNQVVVTGNDNKIDENFIPTTLTGTFDFTGSLSLATSTNIGDLPAWNIGKNIQVFTSTGTSTWSVPEGITKVKVQIQAAGGNGGSCNDSNSESGSGGSAGGYSMEFVDVTGTSTIQYYIGGSGARTTFGTIGSHFLTANSGNNGDVGGAATVGGTAAGGDINITGGPGDAGIPSQTYTGPVFSGRGGNSMFGHGGASVVSTGGTEVNGTAATGYGAGASGGVCANGSASGGTGSPAIMVLEW